MISLADHYFSNDLSPIPAVVIHSFSTAGPLKWLPPLKSVENVCCVGQALDEPGFAPNRAVLIRFFPSEPLPPPVSYAETAWDGLFLIGLTVGLRCGELVVSQRKSDASGQPSVHG